MDVEIKKGREESALYRPCLFKSLIDTRVAQQKITRAGLERAMIAHKYGIPLLLMPGDYNKKQKEQIPPPVVQSQEEDKSSL